MICKEGEMRRRREGRRSNDHPEESNRVLKDIRIRSIIKLQEMRKNGDRKVDKETMKSRICLLAIDERKEHRGDVSRAKKSHEMCCL